MQSLQFDQEKHANLQNSHINETRERVARGMTVAEWARKHDVGREFEKNLGKSNTGWENENNKKLIMEKSSR